MAATQNGPQFSGSGDEPPRNRKHEAQITILLAIIVGCFAGILRRTMEGVSYYEAISTGAVAAIALAGLIFVCLTYVNRP
ncbi:hypothetical protein [Streptomyces sp. NPDC056660]|uniref:hypothetical protein n=1 Tax=Streptomyces sp. NPDC056660 TaxID=3345897 RepID=UPI003673CC07